MIKKTSIIVALASAITFMSGCTTPTMEYRLVHILDTEPGFHYVDPREATEWLMENGLNNVDTFSVYLYEPSDETPFGETSFFTYLGDYVIYIDPTTEKYYTREKSTIKDDITQYYIDKEQFLSGQ